MFPHVHAKNHIEPCRFLSETIKRSEEVIKIDGAHQTNDDQRRHSMEYICIIIVRNPPEDSALGMRIGSSILTNQRKQGTDE